MGLNRCSTLASVSKQQQKTARVYIKRILQVQVVRYPNLFNTYLLPKSYIVYGIPINDSN
jgi:hypothetical protein